MDVESDNAFDWSGEFGSGGEYICGANRGALVVKPYLKSMNRSEIMALMTGGMATIAGGVLVAYMAILGGGDEASSIAFGQHLLTASILSARCNGCIQNAPTANRAGKREAGIPRGYEQRWNTGCGDEGYYRWDQACSQWGGMLLAFTALVAVANWAVANGVGRWTGLNDWVSAITDGRFREFNFSFLAGVLCAPFAWVIGVSWGDCLIVGQLLGERLVLNEFISYLNLAKYQESGAFMGFENSDHRNLRALRLRQFNFNRDSSGGNQRIGKVAATESAEVRF